MSEYFALTADPNRVDLQWAVDQDMGGVDLGLFYSGSLLEQSVVDRIRLLVNDKPPTDLLPNPNGITVVSEQAVGVLERLSAPSDVQILKAPVYSINSGTLIGGYFILNPLRILHSVVYRARPGRRLGSLSQLELRRKPIPPNLNIFRAAQEFVLPIVTASVQKAVYDAGLNGFAFIGLSSVS